MDGARRRRTRDRARRRWYAHHRQVRFARRLGFPRPDVDVEGSSGPAIDQAFYRSVAGIVLPGPQVPISTMIFRGTKLRPDFPGE